MRQVSIRTVIIVLLAGSMNYLGQTLFGVTEFPPLWRFVFIVVGLSGVTVSAVYDGYVVQQTIQEEADIQIQEWREKYERALQSSSLTVLQSLLFVARNFIAPTTSSARACIFMRKGKQLNFFESSGSFSPREGELQFLKRQGIVGSVWHIKGPRVVNLQGLTRKNLKESFFLTTRQIELTRGIGSVIAAPIFVDGNRFVGVLALDSILPLGSSNFGDDDVLNGISEICVLVGKILQQGGFC